MHWNPTQSFKKDFKKYFLCINLDYVSCFWHKENLSTCLLEYVEQNMHFFSILWEKVTCHFLFLWCFSQRNSCFLKSPFFFTWCFHPSLKHFLHNSYMTERWRAWISSQLTLAIWYKTLGAASWDLIIWYPSHNSGGIKLTASPLGFKKLWKNDA